MARETDSMKSWRADAIRSVAIGTVNLFVPHVVFVVLVASGYQFSLIFGQNEYPVVMFGALAIVLLSVTAACVYGITCGVRSRRAVSGGCAAWGIAGIVLCCLGILSAASVVWILFGWPSGDSYSLMWSIFDFLSFGGYGTLTV